MPKEVIVGHWWGAPDQEKRRPQIEVHWHGDGMEQVQIVTKAVAMDGDRLMPPEESKMLTETSGPMSIGTVSIDEPYEYLVTDGFYVDLDRQGINRLIKHLRRARDQAFGRDE